MTRSAIHTLVADDDPAILNAVSRILQLNGFFVVSCTDGHTALRLFEELSPSLVILDLRMPGIDGIEICRRIREHSDVPLILLTAVNDESEAARALETGADDFIRKPFGANEFLARVRAVLRRARVDAYRGQVLEEGPIVLDERQHQVLVTGNEIALSRTEFALLAFLLRNKSRVLTHDYILQGVWGQEFSGSHHLLRVSMSRLRQKLGVDAARNIETLPGVGYRFRAGGSG